MSLRLVIESSPAPQAETERVFSGGRLSIGRSADADWQVDDPKMFVSRRHCVISEEGGRVIVTDASSGGLFIGNASSPVGLGNSVEIEPGMRLHMGDFTLRVEAARPEAPATSAPEVPPARTAGYFSAEAPPPDPEPVRERPENLPDPFGLRTDAERENRHQERARPPRPLDQHNPFGLDLCKPAAEERPSSSKSNAGPASGGYFSDVPDIDPSAGPFEPEPTEVAAKPNLFGDWTTPLPSTKPSVQPPHDEAETQEPKDDIPFPARDVASPAPKPQQAQTGEPERRKDVRTTAPRPGDDLRDALLRGMGLDPAEIPSADPAAEMEHLGRSMQRLVEGVMLLLRTRAQEKQKVRVAQTIIASADVNPLKFLATPEEALAALVRPRGRGYMAPEAALEGAFRDLADHQVRTWSALQVALRRTVDKFDPAEIEKEMEDVGLLESLVAGGRSAKLWQIYQDRYRGIAEAAEKQFLGEVGADFRDAYENRRTD